MNNNNNNKNNVLLLLLLILLLCYCYCYCYYNCYWNNPGHALPKVGSLKKSINQNDTRTKSGGH